MKLQQIWLLHLLLLINFARYTCEPLDCSISSNTTNLQLNASDIVSTWQHSSDADCDGTGWSLKTKRQLYWLVMQLRRPMLVERVSLQGWDGEWLTAGVDGSRLSAFGAASLPLELQLEDPCRASWEVFTGYRGWRIFNETGRERPTSFILINSTVKLQLRAVNITGSLALLQIQSNLFENMMKMVFLDSVYFYVTVCDHTVFTPVTCTLLYADGHLTTIEPFHLYISAVIQRYSFEFNNSRKLHGALLSCSQGESRDREDQKFLITRILPTASNITASSVWVIGRPVSVNFTTFESSPAPIHSCVISHSHNHSVILQLNAISVSRLVTKSKSGKTVVTQTSAYEFKVTESMQGKSIVCEETETYFRSLSETVMNISQVSAPCVTEVDLGSSLLWLEGEVRNVRVTSRNCSIWNVAHTCWLVAGDGGLKNETLKLSTHGNFISIHQLPVNRSMCQGNWSVKCRVNQSGIVYDDVVSRIKAHTHRNAQVLDVSHLTVKIEHVTPIVLITFALTIFATWNLAWSRARAELTQGQQQRCRCVAMVMQPVVNRAPPEARQVGATNVDADMSSPYDFPTVSATDDQETGVYEQPDEQNTDHGQAPVTAPALLCATRSEYINLR